ncbi:class I SAM-dependent methyltransferase [uncultured Methanobacterium sp.]|uniref:class I SAM-dependent methyltransferase n=1 Tax=uncultured Methanobacterium sp. TaxID=176306 RepID=UPI002AA67BEF|nr:class I SAM-dependent methyltransferase [uncultured Methanobacterium sp.]
MIDLEKEDIMGKEVMKKYKHLLIDVPGYYLQVSNVDRRLVDSISLRGKKLLNVGCGGYIISDIYFAMKGADVTSIDIEKWVIDGAKERIAKLDNKEDIKLEVMLADGRQLPFPDNSFDVVTSFSAIEHIEKDEDRLKALMEMARVVKPNGHVVITGPNLLNLPVTFFSGRLHKRIGGFEHRYTRGELKDMYKKCGLKLEEFDAESVYVVDHNLLKDWLPFMGKVPTSFFKPVSACMRVLNNISFLKIFGMRMGIKGRKV